MHNWGGASYYANGYHWGPWAWVVGAMAVPVLLVIVLWSIFWKGLALWHSAQRGQYWWFVILLFVNTLGILEIIYLFAIAKLHFNELFSSKHAHHHEHSH